MIGIGYYFHYFSFFPIDDKADDTKPDTELTEDDFLCVSEGKIVNRCGKTITLEGINLGGWLIQEYWMCPVQGNSAVEQWTNLESLNVLEERFGVQKTQELIKQYESNWITEWDIQNISAMGCNVIRVPFWYRNFMSTPEGAWLSENPDENPGFQRLDWLIEMAEKYGLYVVLICMDAQEGRALIIAAGQHVNLNYLLILFIRMQWKGYGLKLPPGIKKALLSPHMTL